MTTERPVTPAPDGWPARKPRLLLVDDQPIHLQVLYRALGGAHQLFMANGGEPALKLAQEQRPDLILLDVVMPSPDGFAVLERLRASRETADIPVIFVTAHGGEDIETRCLEAGAVDFIPKPINPSVVLGAGADPPDVEVPVRPAAFAGLPRRADRRGQPAALR